MDDNKPDFKQIFPKRRKTYTPTELGKLLDPQKESEAVNRMLADLGLQTKQGSVWVGNPEHAHHWVMKEIPARTSSGSVKVLRWYASVVPILKSALQKPW
ncbi:hypothetical protein D3C72_179200 [compost metagenome]